MTTRSNLAPTVAIASAAVSAVLLWAASPAVGASALAWIAIVPAACAALALPAPAGRIALPVAYAVYLELVLVPSLPFGVASGQWGDAALPIMLGDSPVLAVALLAIPALGVLLYAVRFGSPLAPLGRGVSHRPRRHAVALAVVVPALAWTALELVRMKLDPGGLWGPLSPAGADGPAGGLAGLGGPWLLTFAIVLVNYGVAASVVGRRPSPALATIAAAAVVVGVAEIAVPPTDRAAEVAVAAIQPGYDTSEEDRPELRYFEPGTYDRAALDTIGDLAELTRRAAQRGASLVVWPEAALYVDPRREPRVAARLASLARAVEASIVVPFFDREERRSAAIAVVADRPESPFTRSQPKHRPMWFLGERASEGPSLPIDVADTSVGTMLGVDTQDPGVAAGLADSGAELLTTSTHDWREMSPFHRSVARSVAVASGAAVVRADWRYGSAVYSPSGEVLADAGEGIRRTLVVAEVPLVARPSPYAEIGDVVGWLAVAGALAAIAIPRLSSPTRRSPAPAPG